MIDITQYEEGLVGSLLVDPTLIDEVRDVIGVPDLVTRPLKPVWASAYTLADKGVLSRQALILSLQSTVNLSDIGNGVISGEDYIDSLYEKGAPESMQEFVDQVQNASANRRLRTLFADGLRKIERSERSSEIVQWMAKEVGGMMHSRREPRLVAELNPDYQKRSQLIRSGEWMPFWIPPIQALADKLGKVSDTDFMIIPGKPGTGKSSLLRHMGLETARGGNGALMISLENSEQQTHEWALANLSKVDYFKVSDPSIQSDEDVERILKAQEELSGIPYYVLEMGICTIDTLINRMRKFCLTHTVSVIMIDGLYLIRGNGKSTFEDIAGVMQTLRSAALELHIPIIGSTQFKKQQKKKDGEPEEQELGMDDMYYAGEKQATKIASIRRPRMTQAEVAAFPMNIVNGLIATKPRSVVVNFNILKNSGGPADDMTDDVVWHKPFGAYLTLDKDWRSKSKVPHDVVEKAIITEPARTWNPAPKPKRPEKKTQWKSGKGNGWSRE